MIVLNLFNDPTPTGIINQRLVTHVVRLYAYTDLTEEEKKDLSDLLYFVGMKLVAVWRHLNKYTSIEDRLIKETQRSTSIERQAIKHIRLTSSSGNKYLVRCCSPFTISTDRQGFSAASLLRMASLKILDSSRSSRLTEAADLGLLFFLLITGAARL